MGNCKCTCGNCCSHPKSTDQKNKESQSKFAALKQATKKRAERAKAAFYKPK